ncbi:MAG: VOC family protein [Bacteroides sp.]|nr:VOC family protein [Bacteroides sp.]
MKIKDLSITFHTEKIKECVDFYSKYLQAKLIFDAGWYVSIRLESDHPIYLSFQGCDGGVEANTFAGGVTLNLMVEDVDTCYQSFQETGALFVEEITDHEWGDRAFSLLDPIGNVVYIYSPRELHDKYKEAVKE